LILRDWYRIDDCRVTPDGACPDCGARIAGHYEEFSGQFGRRRIPVAIRTPA
jgi:pyruvate formate lyase activating enzyme